MTMVRCPHCSGVFDTGGASAPPKPQQSQVPFDSSVSNDPNINSLMRMAQQLKLSNPQIATLKNGLVPYSRAVVRDAFDVWFSKNLGSDKSTAYFMGIVRRIDAEYKQTSKRSGGLPPRKD